MGDDLKNMDQDNLKIISFDKYCRACKYYDKDENENPCEQCLDEPVRLYSEKPFYYSKKEEKQKEEVVKEPIKSE